MSIYTKHVLSASTHGKMIKVAATSTPGTAIHTADATAQDELWIYAQNNHTADVLLTLEWGGTTAPDDNIIKTIPTKAGLILIVPGWILENALALKAFAGTTNVISIGGFVNRKS